jgi:hypothetical protein
MITAINSEVDYKTALAEIERLIDAKVRAGPADGDRLNLREEDRKRITPLIELTPLTFPINKYREAGREPCFQRHPRLPDPDPWRRTRRAHGSIFLWRRAIRNGHWLPSVPRQNVGCNFQCNSGACAEFAAAAESGVAAENRRNHHQVIGERPQSALPACGRYAYRPDAAKTRHAIGPGGGCRGAPKAAACWQGPSLQDRDRARCLDFDLDCSCDHLVPQSATGSPA